MERYSNTKLRAYLKYEDGLAVLDLKEKGLSRVPDAVTELSEIKNLVLDKNNLIKLTAIISKLKNLIVLKLDSNNITELPAEIGDLRELRKLDVIRNPFTVDTIRRALKLRKKGVLVYGVEGKHSGYCSYLEVRKKEGEREVIFFFSYRGFREFEGWINIKICYEL